MSAKSIIIAAGVIITAVVTIAHFMYERSRYTTNNPNVGADDFHVHPDPTCPICLDPMNTDGASTALLDCGHFLHRSCLRDMNNARRAYETNKCPICRTPFRYP